MHVCYSLFEQPGPEMWACFKNFAIICGRVYVFSHPPRGIKKKKIASFNRSCYKSCCRKKSLDLSGLPKGRGEGEGEGEGKGEILRLLRQRLRCRRFLDVKGKCCHFKTPKCLSVSRNKEIIVKFVIIIPVTQNCRLVPLAGDRVGRYGLKLEKC